MFLKKKGSSPVFARALAPARAVGSDTSRVLDVERVDGSHDIWREDAVVEITAADYAHAVQEFWRSRLARMENDLRQAKAEAERLIAAARSLVASAA